MFFNYALDIKLQNLISKVMDVPVSEVNENSGPTSLKNWDSFNGLVLMNELQSEFNVKFTLEESFNIKSVSDIIKYLKIHDVSLNN